MLSKLVEFSPDAIFVNCGGRIVYANMATATMLGWPKPEDVIGLDPLSFVHPDFHEAAKARMALTLASWQPNPALEQVWLRRDGTEFPVSVAGVRLDWDGQPAIEVCGRDITEQKRLEREAERARQEAELAALSKSRLVSAVGHDLRQPLQSLLLFASVIEADANLSPQSRVALYQLCVPVGRMGHLLESILDLANLEMGLVSARKRAVDLDHLLAELIEEMTPQACAKKLALRLVRSSLAVESDPMLLSSILRNLIANAIRYTERGKILVGVHRKGPDCLIAVYDTGPGIDADKLQLVFEEFYQIGNQARDSRLGLGLGLSIVRRLADVLGHRIVVRSARGKGSGFCIRVAIAENPQ